MCFINYIPFQVGRKKFGELWSTVKRVIGAHIDPPKRIFFGRLHFGPWGEGGGVLPPQIFTRVTDLPRLASAHYNCDGGPPKKINGENLKFGLQFSV